MAEGKRITRRRFLAGGIAAAVGVPLVNALIEPYALVLETIEILIRDLPKSFDGYRIALLTDLHYPRKISEDFVRRAVRLGQSFNPDLYVVGGDICDHKGSSTVPDLSQHFLDVKAPDGLYGVLGNHDHWLDADGMRKELASNTPLELIESSHRIIERNGEAIAIGGTGDLWEGEVDVEKTFRGVPPGMPRILLSHNPDLAEELDKPVRVDLQLSGHTHGGEVRFPFGDAPFVPSKYGNKFREGLVEGKSHRVYVSRGICSVRRVRFLCRPDVSGIILRRA
jgi:uncharacterized protein